MSKASVLILIAVLVASLAMDRPANAQRPATDVPPVSDGDVDNAADDFLDGCQDSLLLEPFPMLRTLIDLLSQLLDLLNQADQLINGSDSDLPEIPTDPGLIPIPGSDQLGTDGIGDLPTDVGDLPTIPGGVSATDASPGGWGIGPIQSVP
jgi:hypothetical protein